MLLGLSSRWFLFRYSPVSCKRFFATSSVAVPEKPQFFKKNTPKQNALPYRVPPLEVWNVLREREQNAPAVPKLSTLIELGKPRLTALVVLTAMSAYALAPFPGLSLSHLLLLAGGTTLCSLSANSYNQCMEPLLDYQMARTHNRPIPRGAVRPEHGWLFATGAGMLGTIMNYSVNSTVAWLGVLNIAIYMGLYTPLKRVSILNTWVGSIVGAVPPLMGWAACSNGDLFTHPSGILTAAIMYAWQFPHFNSLSAMVREDYKTCGYRMMSWTNPPLNARVALRYTVLCLPLSLAYISCGIVDPWYAIAAIWVNIVFTRKAWTFYRNPSNPNARKLFFGSLMYLPTIFIVTLVAHIMKEMNDYKREPQATKNLDNVSPPLMTLHDTKEQIETTTPRD
ncbi:protoheme I Xfarnesyltransferase [Schizosaccharomyces japonicus yFS275]|uniref:Protoheme IX farnesyltransferase, mitochondrial n=1 Tax=Schizosaccharomyces japonicus (strain yFS275 / FY16936) TaxID=402676 RepID=B6K3I8_SCHJY|nr:protoheme I Xfarnesyltransferase [Schizosaccharomyces japonicus yFS275]EEB08045.1 protoheme I Xfarnesyltransferase [Schizosaccharomyces japonicus yFS275]